MTKYINKILTLVMLLITGVITIWNINNNHYDRLFSCISIIIVVIIPIILNKTIFYLEDKDKFIFNIFIFLAHFLGSIVNLYNSIWWYDLFTHYLSGAFASTIAIFIMKRLNKYNYHDILFNILFALGITFLSAGVWEILEFSSDIIFNTNLQHHIETGVKDTMEDIIAAFLGSITWLFIYLFTIKRKIKYE